LSREDCALLAMSVRYRQSRRCSMSLISMISMWVIMLLLMSNLLGLLADACRCLAAISIAISWSECNSDFRHSSATKLHWTFVLGCCREQNPDLWLEIVHHTVKRGDKGWKLSVKC
jgi:hypothetical protein